MVIVGQRAKRRPDLVRRVADIAPTVFVDIFGPHKAPSWATH
jgi:hypothetical protein